MKLQKKACMNSSNLFMAMTINSTSISKVQVVKRQARGTV